MGKVELNVALLEYTPEPEKVVAHAARMCYSNAGVEELREKVSKQDQQKFVAGLIASGHLSTIEHVAFTFGVEGVSRSLLAQITRHRIASFSVKSQRYVSAKTTDDATTFNYVVPQSITALGADAVAEFEAQMKTMQGWYNDWANRLTGEAANEDARFVLPNAAETKFVVTMNARELLHFFSLRCCNRAQWEIRELAWQMLELVYPIAPSIFKNAGPGCLQGACPEGKNFTCGKIAEVHAKHARRVIKENV